MEKTFYLAFLILLGCGQQKSSELAIVDSVDVKKDTLLIDVVSDSLTVQIAVVPEPELTFKIIPVENNDVLKELMNNPYPKDLDAMKAMLDSMGATSHYENGENGGLSYDSAEVSFNRSYGESICEADIQSRLLALNKNITIGMTLDNFLNLTGVTSSDAANLRYEYTHSAQEHAYTMHFDFVNKTLIRFYYQKDPCVIYD